MLARVQAVLDPHMQWEEQQHLNARAEAEELEIERDALYKWSEAARVSANSSGPYRETETESEQFNGARAHKEGDTSFDMEVAGGVEWNNKLADAYTTYISSRDDSKALDAMDGICDIIKTTGLPEQVLAQTHHVTCPGHVVDLLDPSQACPNCHLIGKEIVKAPMAPGAQEPTGGPVYSDDEARQFMHRVDPDSVPKDAGMPI
jgi:hypothetical protein